jgi:CRP/FNR family cyclic AMP-dependent transcriptional regulator
MKLSKLKLLEIMARIPLFKSLKPAERERVLKAECTFESKLAGKAFIKQGSQDDFFYIILAGSATIKQSGYHIATLKAGQFIGEVGFFCREPRTATVTAETDMLVMQISQNNFQVLPSVIREAIKDKVIVGLAARVNSQTQQIINLQSFDLSADVVG